MTRAGFLLRYYNLDFGKRITKIIQGTGEAHTQYFDFSLLFDNVNEDTHMGFDRSNRAFFNVGGFQLRKLQPFLS